MKNEKRKYLESTILNFDRQHYIVIRRECGQTLGRVRVRTDIGQQLIISLQQKRDRRQVYDLEVM